MIINREFSNIAHSVRSAFKLAEETHDRKAREINEFFILVAIVLILMLAAGCAAADEGQSMTKKFEGFKPSVYLCPTGAPTIGYGFNIEEKFIRKHIPADVLKGHREITKAEADAIFPAVYAQAVRDAKKYLGKKTFVSLNSVKRNIIVDMAYTLGYARLSKFKKLQAAVKTGDYELASAEIKNSLWYKQTKSRGAHHAKSISK